MNILYMTMSYDYSRNGLYQNLVEALLMRGHSVTIVRCNSDIDKTYYHRLESSFDMLTVKTGNPFSKNIIEKGLNQISLSLYFKKAIKGYLGDRKFDLILYATPPVTLSGVVKFCKRKYNAKTFLMLKDIFPQNAVDLEIMKNGSLIYKYFRNKEKAYYKYSDYIGCMSQGNVDYVLKHNPEVSPNKIGIFANSVKIEEIENLSFNEDKTVFILGGNLGKPQNISGLLNIIEKAKDINKAEFLIVGKGTEQKKIEKFISQKRIKNLTYKQYVPQEEYYKLLNSADVGLISLDPRFTIPNTPSKFQHYLKLKKPVLAITDLNTDIKDMILDNNCGWWCDATKTEDIVNMVKNICDNKDEQILKGENGRIYLEKMFDVNLNVEKLELFFQQEDLYEGEQNE